MALHEIEIVIDSRGTTTFQVKGIQGKACLGETKFLEEALGGQILSRDTTGDYYGDPTAGVRTYVGDGSADETEATDE